MAMQGKPSYLQYPISSASTPHHAVSVAGEGSEAGGQGGGAATATGRDGATGMPPFQQHLRVSTSLVSLHHPIFSPPHPHGQSMGITFDGVAHFAPLSSSSSLPFAQAPQGHGLPISSLPFPASEHPLPPPTSSSLPSLTITDQVPLVPPPSAASHFVAQHHHQQAPPPYSSVIGSHPGPYPISAALTPPPAQALPPSQQQQQQGGGGQPHVAFFSGGDGPQAPSHYPGASPSTGQGHASAPASQASPQPASSPTIPSTLSTYDAYTSPTSPSSPPFFASPTTFSTPFSFGPNSPPILPPGFNGSTGEYFFRPSGSPPHPGLAQYQQHQHGQALTPWPPVPLRHIDEFLASQGQQAQGQGGGGMGGGGFAPFSPPGGTVPLPSTASFPLPATLPQVPPATARSAQDLQAQPLHQQQQSLPSPPPSSPVASAAAPVPSATSQPRQGPTPTGTSTRAIVVPPPAVPGPTHVPPSTSLTGQEGEEGKEGGREKCAVKGCGASASCQLSPCGCFLCRDHLGWVLRGGTEIPSTSPTSPRKPKKLFKCVACQRSSTMQTGVPSSPSSSRTPLSPPRPLAQQSHEEKELEAFSIHYFSSGPARALASNSPPPPDPEPLSLPSEKGSGTRAPPGSPAKARTGMGGTGMGRREDVSREHEKQQEQKQAKETHPIPVVASAAPRRQPSYPSPSPPSSDFAGVDLLYDPQQGLIPRPPSPPFPYSSSLPLPPTVPFAAFPPFGVGAFPFVPVLVPPLPQAGAGGTGEGYDYPPHLLVQQQQQQAQAQAQVAFLQQQQQLQAFYDQQEQAVQQALLGHPHQQQHDHEPAELSSTDYPISSRFSALQLSLSGRHARDDGGNGSRPHTARADLPPSPTTGAFAGSGEAGEAGWAEGEERAGTAPPGLMVAEGTGREGEGRERSPTTLHHHQQHSAQHEAPFLPLVSGLTAAARSDSGDSFSTLSISSSPASHFHQPPTAPSSPQTTFNVSLAPPPSSSYRFPAAAPVQPPPPSYPRYAPGGSLGAGSLPLLRPSKSGYASSRGGRGGGALGSGAPFVGGVGRGRRMTSPFPASSSSVLPAGEAEGTGETMASGTNPFRSTTGLGGGIGLGLGLGGIGLGRGRGWTGSPTSSRGGRRFGAGGGGDSPTTTVWSPSDNHPRLHPTLHRSPIQPRTGLLWPPREAPDCSLGSGGVGDEGDVGEEGGGRAGLGGRDESDEERERRKKWERERAAWKGEWPIVKVENIPFSTRMEDILDWLPEGYLAPADEVVMPIHLVLHRATGRTLPHLYLLVINVQAGAQLIATMDRSILGDRTVRVKWEREGEMMRDFFHQEVFFQQPLAETHRSPAAAPLPHLPPEGFRLPETPLSSGDLQRLLQFCNNNVQFRERPFERAFYNLISLISKYPWSLTEIWDDAFRNEFYGVAEQVAQKTSGYAEVNETFRDVLEKLVGVVLECPAFTPAQKTHINTYAPHVSAPTRPSRTALAATAASSSAPPQTPPQQARSFPPSNSMETPKHQMSGYSTAGVVQLGEFEDAEVEVEGGGGGKGGKDGGIFPPSPPYYRKMPPRAKGTEEEHEEGTRGRLQEGPAWLGVAGKEGGERLSRSASRGNVANLPIPSLPPGATTASPIPSSHPFSPLSPSSPPSQTAPPRPASVSPAVSFLATPPSTPPASPVQAKKEGKEQERGYAAAVTASSGGGGEGRKARKGWASHDQ
ncbi:hypothetical protein JCM8547_002160 [Rhodosporidiobolus lusitaniae]